MVGWEREVWDCYPKWPKLPGTCARRYAAISDLRKCGLGVARGNVSPFGQCSKAIVSQGEYGTANGVQEASPYSYDVLTNIAAYSESTKKSAPQHIYIYIYIYMVGMATPSEYNKYAHISQTLATCPEHSRISHRLGIFSAVFCSVCLGLFATVFQHVCICVCFWNWPCRLTITTDCGMSASLVIVWKWSPCV